MSKVRLVDVEIRGKRLRRLRVPVARNVRIREALDGTRWHAQIGAWAVPPEEAVRLLAMLPDLEADPACAETARLLQIARNVLAARELTQQQLREAVSRPEFWDPRLVPFQHQSDAMTFVADSLAAALWHDTGLGKTIAGGMWLCRVLGDAPLLRKAWVVCPKILIDTAWEPDLHRYFPGIEFVNVRRLPKAKRVGALQQKWRRGPCVALINYEALRADPELRSLLRGAAVIFDEASKIRNTSTLSFRSMFWMSKFFRATLLLSGTPAPNSPSEYYAYTVIFDQVSGYRCFDEKTRRAWEATWFWRADNGRLALIEKKKEEFYERLKPVCQWLRKHECVDLPDNLVHHIDVPMAKKAWDLYVDLERDLRQLIKDEAIFAAFGRMIRLRQITAGFFPNSRRAWLDGEEVEMIDVDHGKDDWCAEFAKDNEGERIVIWCQFHYETDRLFARLTREKIAVDVVDGRTKDPAEVIQRFKDGDLQVLIMHPRKAQFGISLPGVSFSIYHSGSYSFEEFSQSQNRIHGIGRGKEDTPSTHYVLQGTSPRGGDESIDHAMAESMESKASQMEMMFRFNRLERHRDAARDRQSRGGDTVVQEEARHHTG